MKAKQLFSIHVLFLIFINISYSQNENPTKEQTLQFISNTIGTYFNYVHIPIDYAGTHNIKSVEFNVATGQICFILTELYPDNQYRHIVFTKLSFAMKDINPSSYAIDANEFLTEVTMYLNPNSISLYQSKNKLTGSESKLIIKGDEDIPHDILLRLGKAFKHAHKLYGGSDLDLFK